MVPSRSVMTTTSAACSTALESLRSFSSARRRSVKFRSISRISGEPSVSVKGKIVDVVIAAVGGGPFPLVGRARLERYEALALGTGIGTVKDVLIAAPALRFAKMLPEAAVGEAHMMVRREQANHYGQHFQDSMKPPALRLRRGFRAPPLGHIAKIKNDGFHRRLVQPVRAHTFDFP